MASRNTGARATVYTDKCHRCGAPAIFHDMCDYCQADLCVSCMDDGCCGRTPAVSYWAILAKETEVYERFEEWIQTKKTETLG